MNCLLMALTLLALTICYSEQGTVARLEDHDESNLTSLVRELKEEINGMRRELDAFKSMQELQEGEDRTNVHNLQQDQAKEQAKIAESLKELAARDAISDNSEAEGPVAFTAIISSVYKRYYVGEIVIYDQALYNNGNAYNPSTGKFTCPEAGVYLFTLSILSVDEPLAVMLVKGGVELVSAYLTPRHTWDHSTNTAIVHCLKGEQVWTFVNYANPNPAGIAYGRNTAFSGARLR